MAKSKKMKNKNGVKAVKNDIVMHNGQKWTVLDRDFDPSESRSFYLLGLGTGPVKKSYRTVKWARSDKFSNV
jgi:hypothetical protein